MSTKNYPEKLYIAMVGLPASGKSTIAVKLRNNLNQEGLNAKIFNNGVLRRELLSEESAKDVFFSSNNQEGTQAREEIAKTNIQRAKEFLSKNGKIAILDATNSTTERRKYIEKELNNYPILFIECQNNDAELIKTSIMQKTKLREFSEMPIAKAFSTFEKRIENYKGRFMPLNSENNAIIIDSVNNRILDEWINDKIKHYALIRNIIVTNLVKNLFLIRHGETFFNQEDRIGGDSGLTKKGQKQASDLAKHFKDKDIKYIFTSTKKRTIEMATPLKESQEDCEIISLPEFDEIDAGICEEMTYDEIKKKHPEIYSSRRKDKYNYIYPNGEGYASMKERVFKGVKKALYLAGWKSENIAIVGHQAVNRLILSHFLYTYEQEIPNLFIPQNKLFHIMSTQNKKLFELEKFYNE